VDVVVNLRSIWAMLFEPPPGPPQELIAARRELRTDIIHARLAARKTRRAAKDTMDRLGEVTELVHNGGHR
jgi:hypothetical protein